MTRTSQPDRAGNLTAALHERKWVSQDRFSATSGDQQGEADLVGQDHPGADFTVALFDQRNDGDAFLSGALMRSSSPPVRASGTPHTVDG